MTEGGWRPGDRVRVYLPERWGKAASQARWNWFPGTVREVNTGSQPGVRVDLDFPVNGVSDCYATHTELRRLEDGSDDA